MLTARTQTCRLAFTLVEVIIVCLVLAIAAAVVIPMMGTAAESQVVSAARVLTADIEAAHSLALTTQHPHSVVFSPDFSKYKVVRDYGGEAYSAAVAVNHPVRKGHAWELTLANQSGMSGVAVTNVNFGGEGYVTFGPQGDPENGGYIVLGAYEVVRQVTVEPLTGVVTVSAVGG